MNLLFNASSSLNSWIANYLLLILTLFVSRLVLGLEFKLIPDDSPTERECLL